MNLWCVSAMEPDYPSGRRSISIPLRQASLLITSLLITENSGEGGRFLPTEGSRQAGPTCLVTVMTAAGSGRLSLPDSCSCGPGVVRGWGNSTEQNRKPHFWSSGSERQVKSIRPTAHQLELSVLEEGPAGQGRPLGGQHLNKRLQEGGRAACMAGGRTLWRQGRTDSRPLTSGTG